MWRISELTRAAPPKCRADIDIHLIFHLILPLCYNILSFHLFSPQDDHADCAVPPHTVIFSILLSNLPRKTCRKVIMMKLTSKSPLSLAFEVFPLTQLNQGPFRVSSSILRSRFTTLSAGCSSIGPGRRERWCCIASSAHPQSPISC